MSRVDYACPIERKAKPASVVRPVVCVACLVFIGYLLSRAV